MTTSIRTATIEDLPWSMRELTAFDKSAGLHFSLVGDKAEVEGMLTNVIENHVFLIAVNGHHRAGLICGYRGPHPYNMKLLVLNEMFWWVAPEFRGSRAGLMLLNEFVEIGKQTADWVCVSSKENSPIGDRVLTRRGFTMREKNYLLEVI